MSALGSADAGALGRLGPRKINELIRRCEQDMTRGLIGDAGAAGVDFLAAQPLEEAHGFLPVMRIDVGLSESAGEAGHDGQADKKIIGRRRSRLHPGFLRSHIRLSLAGI